LSSGGLSKIVYEHFLGCFILEDPSSKFLELILVITTIARGGIFRLVALMLGAGKLLVMAKDVKGLRPIAASKVFLQLISCSIVL
jgi:hypothetical protein